jgi:hypothetical protein
MSPQTLLNEPETMFMQKTGKDENYATLVELLKRRSIAYGIRGRWKSTVNGFKRNVVCRYEMESTDSNVQRQVFCEFGNEH